MRFRGKIYVTLKNGLKVCGMFCTGEATHRYVHADGAARARSIRGGS